MKLPKIDRAYKVLCQLTPAELEALAMEAAESIDVPLQLRGDVAREYDAGRMAMPSPRVARALAAVAIAKRAGIRAQQKTPGRSSGGRGRARARGRSPGPPRRGEIRRASPGRRGRPTSRR